MFSPCPGTVDNALGKDSRDYAVSVRWSRHQIVKGIISLKALSSDAADKLEWLNTLRITTSDGVTRLDALVPAEALQALVD